MTSSSTGTTTALVLAFPLAQLATKTQVIVLTHHSNLVDVALRATDGRIHLMEL